MAKTGTSFVVVAEENMKSLDVQPDPSQPSYS
jgi:hypothetical protein